MAGQRFSGSLSESLIWHQILDRSTAVVDMFGEFVPIADRVSISTPRQFQRFRLVSDTMIQMDLPAERPGEANRVMSKPDSLPSVAAFGIGVSDLAASAAFYENTLGMKRVLDLSLGHMDEVILLFPDGGSAIALMHWTDGSARNYADNPVKIVLRVADPKLLAERIRAAGLPVIRDPEPAAEVGGAVVGFAKDPDGYLIELLESV
ncbi:VOC family protein [Maricaulis maris]|uniref:VOC family protein n=1 Tax=Maricaulis maris TaxID=74318 RepID=UPI0026ECA771|nr:VOC family protein [Maricaulis maris]